MKKPYNITEIRENGRIIKRIRLHKEHDVVFETKFEPHDHEAERKAIKSADMCIIKNNLNYETKRLKKVCK